MCSWRIINYRYIFISPVKIARVPRRVDEAAASGAERWERDEELSGAAMGPLSIPAQISFLGGVSGPC